MVNCESCGAPLDEEHCEELEDKNGGLHLVCKHCKKFSTEVLKVFGVLDWKAFVKFVARHNQAHQEVRSAIPIKRGMEK